MPKTKLHWPDLGKYPFLLRWIFLFLATTCVVLALEALQIPAALLLGPMIAAIAIAVSNAEIKIFKPLFLMAQGVVGCMIARVITHDIIAEVFRDLPLFIGGVFSVILIAYFLGFLLTKWQVLPGTTAIWGSAPGGAATMVLMAEAYGADERLVAVMQYLRVVIVSLLASMLSRFVAPSSTAAFQIDWFPTIEPFWFAITLLIALGGSIGSRYLRIPAGGMIVPFLLAVILQYFDFITLVLPPWLLALSYMIIGWTIGLRFTRTILRHAIKALPALIGSILVLITICALLALAMQYFTGIDLLTAYLATSPGGADSVAIIAASTAVNVPFVMAFQMTRFIIVTITGPIMSKFIANKLQLKG